MNTTPFPQTTNPAPSASQPTPAPLMRRIRSRGQAQFRSVRLLYLGFLAAAYTQLRIDPTSGTGPGGRRDRGAISVEWAVITGVIIAVAIALALKVKSAVETHSANIQ